MSDPLQLNEQSMLAYLIKFPEKIKDVPEELFSVDMSKILFNGIDYIVSKDMSLTSRNLANITGRKDGSITTELIDPLFKLEVKENEFPMFLEYLKADITKKHIEAHANDLLVQVHKKGAFPIDRIETHLDGISSGLSNYNSIGMGKVLKQADDIFDDYEATLLDRHSQGTSKYSSGDRRLDELLLHKYAPKQVISLVGATGSGKTTAMLNLYNKRINLNIPCLSLNMEMPTVSLMDKLMAMRCHVPMQMFQEGFRDKPLFEEQMRLVKIERSILKGKKFVMCEQTGLSIKEVQKKIQETKKLLGVDYLIVTLDLGTMLKDFNTSDKTGFVYEKAMNELDRVAKEENVCIEFVAQLGQEAEDSKGVKSPYDIYKKMRPKIDQIKNANAIRERSRVVLSIFRPYHYIKLMFPEAVEAHEDIMYMTVLKQNMGSVGGVYQQKFHPEMSLLLPYTPPKKVDLEEVDDSAKAS